MSNAAPHRVLVIGGGFGGLNVTQELAEADVLVTLVDRTNHHLFQPLLYQVAAGILPTGLIAPTLRTVLKKQRNARVLLAEAHDVDVDRKVVKITQPDTAELELPYDTLVIAAGATHSYFGNDHFAKFAPGMKTIEDARYVRDAILSKFEMAEFVTDPEERAHWLTFVVVGAGPTGVELVGQIAELAHKVLPPEFRHVNTSSARIILLEGAPAVLPSFDEKLQRYTQKVLEKMGVEVRVNTLAVDMDHDSVTVKGPDGVESIPTKTRIWAAGVQASELAQVLARQTGAETDRMGRIAVNPDCSLPGHPEIFAIGDMALLNELPGVAQPAMQEGRYVGKLIRARLEGDPAPKPFKYFDKGSMATIGHRAAVAHSFKMNFTGVIAYLMWVFIHVMYLVGWGNRIGTLYTWTRSLYFTKTRPQRIITYDRAWEEVTDARPQFGRAITPRAADPALPSAESSPSPVADAATETPGQTP